MGIRLKNSYIMAENNPFDLFNISKSILDRD
jgi:hypothetical protein